MQLASDALITTWTAHAHGGLDDASLDAFIGQLKTRLHVEVARSLLTGFLAPYPAVGSLLAAMPATTTLGTYPATLEYSSLVAKKKALREKILASVSLDEA